MVKKLCGLGLVLALVNASPAPAQVPGVGFEVEAYGGAFVPLLDVVDEENLLRSHKPGLGLGGRLTLGLPGPLAIEGNFLYALSDVEETVAGTPTDIDANVWAASGLLAFRLGLPAVPVSFHVAGGAAYIDRTGDAYDGAEETSDIAGIADIGMRVGLPAIIKIRVDVESYIYKAAIVEGATEFGSEFQADIVVSAGMVFSFL